MWNTGISISSKEKNCFCSFWFRLSRWSQSILGLASRARTNKYWNILEYSWHVVYWSITMGVSSEVIGITAWIAKLQFDLCYPVHLIPTCMSNCIVIPTWLHTTHQPGVWSRQVIHLTAVKIGESTGSSHSNVNCSQCFTHKPTLKSGTLGSIERRYKSKMSYRHPDRKGGWIQSWVWMCLGPGTNIGMEIKQWRMFVRQ